MDHEVSVQGAAGRSSGACPRPDPADLPGAGGEHRAGGGVAGSYPHVGGGATAVVAGEAGAVHQGAIVASVQEEFPHLRKRYWGQHLWARGYFCATVGAVDEATIKAYIENQKWDEDDQGFKITAPTEP